MKITKNSKIVADVEDDKKELVDIAIKEAKCAIALFMSSLHSKQISW